MADNDNNAKEPAANPLPESQENLLELARARRHGRQAMLDAWNAKSHPDGKNLLTLEEVDEVLARVSPESNTPEV
jgi:hypothetical protein